MNIAQFNVISFGMKARTDMLGAMMDLPRDAPLARPGFGIPLVIAGNFTTANHVLVTDADSYRKPWVIRQVIEDGLGENLFTTDGDAWLSRRQPCAPVFGLQQMDDLTATMASTVIGVAESWSPGSIDIQAAMTNVTMQIALRGLLGTSDDTAELARTVQEDFEEILAWITFRFSRPASPPSRVPTSRNRRLKAARARLQTSVRQLIVHRRSNPSDAVDILSQLVRAQSGGPHDLSDDAIVDECIGFMFAGHETTAATLTWALYELALRPDLQDVIAQEAARLATTTPGLGDRVTDLAQTSAVVEETLRMYPAGISIARSAKRTTEISGHRIRKGTMVMIPVYNIQRSASTRENPNTFDPSQARDGDSFLAFGRGPRRCLGARFARTEMRLALALLCARWKFTYEPARPPIPIVAPSLRADGELPLALTKRVH